MRRWPNEAIRKLADKKIIFQTLVINAVKLFSLLACNFPDIANNVVWP